MIARNHSVNKIHAHNRTEVKYYNHLCILLCLHCIPNIDSSNLYSRMFALLTDLFPGQPDNLSIQAQPRLETLARMLHKRQNLCLQVLNRILLHHGLVLLAMTRGQSLEWNVVTHNANLSLLPTTLSGDLHHHRLRKMNQVQVSRKAKMKVIKAMVVAWPPEKWLMEEMTTSNCF